MTILELIEDLKDVYEKYGDGEVYVGGTDRDAVDIEDVDGRQYIDGNVKRTCVTLKMEFGYEAMNPSEDYSPWNYDY